MKTISFAIPCYNSAEYMDKCIQSILDCGGQAGIDDIEIVIVDDGSVKDNTAEKADEWQERYPGVIKAVHQENGGHGQAVNTGLAHAQGLYFKVVDSDDWQSLPVIRTVASLLRSLSPGLTRAGVCMACPRSTVESRSTIRRWQ